MIFCYLRRQIVPFNEFRRKIDNSLWATFLEHVFCSRRVKMEGLINSRYEHSTHQTHVYRFYPLLWKTHNFTLPLSGQSNTSTEWTEKLLRHYYKRAHRFHSTKAQTWKAHCAHTKHEHGIPRQTKLNASACIHANANEFDTQNTR